MATITLSLNPKGTRVAVEAAMSEVHQAVTVLGAILPGLRLAGFMSAPDKLKERKPPKLSKNGGGGQP